MLRDNRTPNSNITVTTRLYEKKPGTMDQEVAHPLAEIVSPTVEHQPVNSYLRPEQAEALLTISALLNSELNPGLVLTHLLQHICSLFRVSRSAVFLRKNLQRELVEAADKPATPLRDNEPNPEIGPVICAANFGLSEAYVNQIITYYEDREFGKLQSIRHPVYIADAQKDSSLNGLRELNQREGFQTMLTLPLLYRNLLIGVLVLYNDQPRAYSKEELRLLTIFTNQAALSITNARLYEEARRREKEASLLAEASRELSATLKLNTVLHSVVELATNMLGNTALVYIVRENTDMLYPVSYLSRIPVPEGVSEYSPVKANKTIKIGQTVVGKVVQTGTPILLRDKANMTKIAPFVRAEEGVESLLCVPMKVNGRIIAALAIYNVIYPQQANRTKAPSPLEDRHLALALALADRAAIAIENSRSYEAEKIAQRTKDEFLSLIAHELRTPLTSLKGYNRLVAKHVEEGVDKPETLHQYSTVMSGQIDRLQTLVEDLTSISEIQTGKVELHINQADVVQVVKKQVAEMEALLTSGRTPRLNFNFDVRAYPPAIMVDVDVNALDRVLHSVLSNAVKFSPKGGNIRIRVQQALDEVTVSIQDEGMGITPEDRLRIFERFYKSNSGVSRANGLGLGLYISQGLLRAMGGRIEVESEEGNGSIFTLFLRQHYHA